MVIIIPINNIDNTIDNNIDKISYETYFIIP